jgi:hypothetical protein
LAIFAKKNHADPSLCANRVSERCGFIGNQDFYGLGIRLGLYIQWIASLFAYACLPEERRGLAGAYATFSFALSVALLILAFENQCTFDAEIIIILFIFFGGVFGAVSPLGKGTEPFGSVFYGVSSFHAMGVGRTSSTVPAGPEPQPQDGRAQSDRGSLPQPHDGQSPETLPDPESQPQDERAQSDRGSLPQPLPAAKSEYISRAAERGLSVVLLLLTQPMLIFSSWFWVSMGNANTDTFKPTPCGTSFFLFSHVTPNHVTTASRFMAFCSIWFAITPYLTLCYAPLQSREYHKLSWVVASLTPSFWANLFVGFFYEFFKACCNPGRANTSSNDRDIELNSGNTERRRSSGEISVTDTGKTKEVPRYMRSGEGNANWYVLCENVSLIRRKAD